MPVFEICFLTLVVASFVVFAGSLLIVDYRSRKP